MVPEFSDWMAESSVGPSRNPKSGCVPLEDDQRRDGDSIHNNYGGYED